MRVDSWPISGAFSKTAAGQPGKHLRPACLRTNTHHTHAAGRAPLRAPCRRDCNCKLSSRRASICIWGGAIRLASTTACRATFPSHQESLMEQAVALSRCRLQHQQRLLQVPLPFARFERVGLRVMPELSREWSHSALQASGTGLQTCCPTSSRQSFALAGADRCEVSELGASARLSQCLDSSTQARQDICETCTSPLRDRGSLQVRHPTFFLLCRTASPASSYEESEPDLALYTRTYPRSCHIARHVCRSSATDRKLHGGAG
jgi:hypothetical protein